MGFSSLAAAPRDAPARPGSSARLLSSATLLLGEAELPGLCTATAPAFWRVFCAYSVLGLPVAIIARHEGAPIPTVYNPAPARAA